MRRNEDLGEHSSAVNMKSNNSNYATDKDQSYYQRRITQRNRTFVISYDPELHPPLQLYLHIAFKQLIELIVYQFNTQAHTGKGK